MNSLLKSLTPLAVLAAVALGAQAADFPVKDKPITIVVPFTAGGPTDRVARDLFERARFLEEMRRPGDELEFHLAVHPRHRLWIESRRRMRRS